MTRTHLVIIACALVGAHAQASPLFETVGGIGGGGFNARFRLWALFAFGAGLLLGGLTLWTNNLLAAILCHLTVNYFNLHTVIQEEDESWG